MDRTSVTSSALKSIGYDADTQTLEVEFPADKLGRPVLWRYNDVAPETHAKIMEASSVGGAFHALIRKAGVAGRRVDTEDAAA
jgi:hypothetical protein